MGPGATKGRPPAHVRAMRRCRGAADLREDIFFLILFSYLPFRGCKHTHLLQGMGVTRGGAVTTHRGYKSRGGGKLSGPGC